MRIWIPILLVLAIGIGLNKAKPSMLLQEPHVLKVCQDCPYDSIQAAVDTAQPGDVIEVYPMFSHPLVAYYPTAVVISKPLTLEAKPIPPWEVVLIPQKFPDQPGSSLLVDPIFRIQAESGRVIIRGFVFQDEGLVWHGGADLLLEHNRFRRTTPWSSISIGLSGPGRAQLVENEMDGIDGLAIEDGAEVLLKANRIRPRSDQYPDYGLIYITRSSLLPPKETEKFSNVVFEQNLIEGTVSVGCGQDVRLESNILLGGLSLRGTKPEIGLLIHSCAKGYPPTVVQTDRNIIAQYQVGVSIDFCEGAPQEALQLSGQENVIEQNGQDLCPADYPWPPGFRK